MQHTETGAAMQLHNGLGLSEMKYLKHTRHAFSRTPNAPKHNMHAGVHVYVGDAACYISMQHVI